MGRYIYSITRNPSNPLHHIRIEDYLDSEVAFGVGHWTPIKNLAQQQTAMGENIIILLKSSAVAKYLADVEHLFSAQSHFVRA